MPAGPILYTQNYPLAELPQVAQAMLAACPAPGPIALYGEMGAGKTTLVRELCRQLGAQVAATSPTFTLVQEYPAPAAPTGVLYHLDLYRLAPESALEQTLDLGISELLASGAWCFVEWPERIAPLWEHEPHLALYLEITGPETRRIQLDAYLDADVS